MIILSSVSFSLTGLVLSRIDPLFFNLIEKGFDFIVFIRSSMIEIVFVEAKDLWRVPIRGETDNSYDTLTY